MLFAVLPVIISIWIVVFAHLLAKIGVGVPAILLEPIVDFYIFGVGAMGTLCFFFRQFVMFIIYAIIMLGGLAFIYISYVL